ncbi:LysR family transcriptional regulator [Virgibacillus sp. NKC19-16]|uniref:LysR substrate-binding domain-containing protein n=1 Tax=Virgibacillus salidurans TaxID=2831673 RepID=UPI001F1C8435|nr:LysR substrate-binding domain-containing protein [Virgibacillus sp. NKC19-16]UJL47186.1 LysR family transcriptional regulator [Virgibacillus sp. NKC19-16]
MNIDNLRMFCHVVKEGTITKAAHLGFVSQPAVTRQIRQLEDSYGTTLFDREEGKLKLTEAGKLLYPYAKEILALNKAAYEGIQEQVGEMEKILHIGASLTIGEYLLPGLIGRFEKLHPDIKFNLSIGNTPLILQKLEENEIDIALVEGVFQNDQYKKQKFADDELILVTPYAHRWGDKREIELNELPEEKMILREKESGTRLIVEDALRLHHVLENIENAMELGSTQAIKSAVEADLGVSILPKLTAQKELKYKTLREIPIKDFHLTRDFWMVQKKRRFKRVAQTYFEAFLMK